MNDDTCSIKINIDNYKIHLVLFKITCSRVIVPFSLFHAKTFKTTLKNNFAKLLSWQLQLLPLENLGDVEIEEVAVEDGLDAAGNDGDDVVEPLVVVAVDPVENVESAVGAEREEIVAGDGLGLAGLGDHEELGQDGDTLQVDGEGPQDLHHAELVVDDQRQQDAGAEQELHAEGVVVTIVGRLKISISIKEMLIFAAFRPHI